MDGAMSGPALRTLLREGYHALHRRLRRPQPGRFQPYSYTLPDRYPWIFGFVRDQLSAVSAPRLLSFGCSRGDEVFALRGYFPDATIRGLDICKNNIAACRAHLKEDVPRDLSFAIAATTEAEPADHYDAIFCLAVLCHGDLTVTGARRCDPLMHFAEFQKQVADFARCLKPGGFLLLHTTNFRFSDTDTASDFETVLEAEPEQLATDVLFDRDNRLMPGVRYRPVGFRKRTAVLRES
jgi:2-polyprenyl-3-methyl-5-hydroxy-6-metoxy-1,4-benzoquinol methylase